MNLRHRHVLNSNRANSQHWVLNSNRANSRHLVWVLNSNRANSRHLVWVLNSNRANSRHLVRFCFSMCFYHLLGFQRATVLKLIFVLWESMVARLCAVKVYVVCAVSYFLLCPSICNSFSTYRETQYNYGMCFLWWLQFATRINCKIQFMAFVYYDLYTICHMFQW